MIQGIYIASSGMTPLMDKQDQIANNLANINTTGFKQSGLFIKTYQKFLSNDLRQPFVNNEIKPDEVYLDYSEGAMKRTSLPLDLCIKGSGFFTVMSSEGVRYTRNGNLSIDAEGLLVTNDGAKVMSNDGYIRVERNVPIVITEKGEVTQNGNSKGFLKISDFNKPYKLLRCGNSLLQPQLPETPVVQPKNFEICQGYLESSNVNIVRNMVEMISAYRNFEADQKAVQAQDQTLEKAVNEVGKI
jgi:flagellar basal-body rod protein FlgF